MEYRHFNNEDSFDYNYLKSSSPPNISPHFHNFFEILYFQKGEGVYMVEGKNYQLFDGDVLITNPHELHCPIFKSPNEYQRSIISFKPLYLADFISEKYNPFSALEKRRLGTQNRIDVNIVKKYQIDKRINEIGIYFDSDLPEKELMIKSILIQILVILNNIITSGLHTTKSGNIDNIIQYINDNLFEKITLDTLECIFHLNKYHIAHSFKDKTGFTILDYIARKRIALSKELILSNMPLTEVAGLIGFGDYSNFYRTFVKINGFPPNKIKNNSKL